MTQQEARPKPVPIVNPWARPFWDGAREGRLMIQQCHDCGKHIFYPRVACPHCASDRLEWVEASGRGTVYSYTVVYNNAPSAFLADIPYVVAVINLAEGVRLARGVGGVPHSRRFPGHRSRSRQRGHRRVAGCRGLP